MGQKAAMAVILMLLAACQPGAKEPPLAQNKTPQTVLTTFTVLADMAQNVAGDRLRVESLIKPGAEVHGYEPTPQDLQRGAQAVLILDNGFNLERWAERFFQNFPQLPHRTLSQGIKPVFISADAYQGQPNPHAWMSPQNALIYVENIRQALRELDPAQADIYDRNARAYQEEIKLLDQRLRQAVQRIPPQQRYLVSCEGAFSYLAQDYELKEIYLWPVNAERQATPQQVARVIEQVKSQKIPAIFCESTVNAQTQRQVAQESGARYGGVFYVDSLSPADGPAPTYLKLLEHNINTLIKGLSPQSHAS